MSSAKLPPAAFVCADAPDIPATVTDQSVATFFVELYNAWWDCKFQLNAVGRVQ